MDTEQLSLKREQRCWVKDERDWKMKKTTFVVHKSLRLMDKQPLKISVVDHPQIA